MASLRQQIVALLIPQMVTYFIDCFILIGKERFGRVSFSYPPTK